jgi:membrane protein
MGWNTIKRVLRQLYGTYECWDEDDVAQHAAAVSYYMALSFFPLLIVLFSVASTALHGTAWGQNARQELLDLISLQSAPQLAAYVATVLESAEVNAPTSGPLGFLMLIVAAMAVFSQFEQAFDRIWRTPEPKAKGLIPGLRDIIRRRLRAFLMLTAVSVLVLAGFLATMALSAAQKYLADRFPLPPSVWSLSTAAAAVAMNWPLFAVIYKVLPNVPVRWAEAARGAILAAALWEIGRRVLASLIIGTQYSVYGVVGAFIAIMLWVYYAVTVIFLGAEFVQVARRASEVKCPDPC